jgi:hypothetical protein
MLVKDCHNMTKRFFGRGTKIKLEKVKEEIKKTKYRRARYNRNPPADGAVNELKVSSDLLTKGYDVFRQLQPASTCDLVVIKDDKLYRVEVTAGKRTAAGYKYHKHDPTKYDVLALVLPDSSIHYEPPLG